MHLDERKNLRKYKLPEAYKNSLFGKGKTSEQDLKSIQIINKFLSSRSPLAVEIGCGTGYHPVLHSKNFPNINLVAIEKTKAKYRTFLNRYQGNRSPGNLLPIHGDGEIWVASHFPDNSVDKFFLLYPNPYHKKAQENLRWYNRPFINELIQKLKTEGEIELRTNISEYIEEANEFLSSKQGLKIKTLREIVLDKNEICNAQTHFELKYLKRKEKCYLGIWQKS